MRSDALLAIPGVVIRKVLPAVDNYRRATGEISLRLLSFVEYSQGIENLLARQRGNHHPRVGPSSPSSATRIDGPMSARQTVRLPEADSRTACT